MNRDKIRVLTVSGAPYDLGYRHGQAYREEIRHYAAERVALVMEGKWSGNHQLSRAQVLELADACVPAHDTYAPNLMAELRGIAEASDLTLGEMIVVNGFTDFIDTVYNTYKRTTPLEPQLAIDDCTAFIIPDDLAEGAGFFGQTWDMHDTATDYVIMLRVEAKDKPRALVFTTTGCVGQIGMNEHGLAVGINNLLGADGQVGVTWPFVIRKALQQDNIEAALACITEAPLAGAHNYLLFDRQGNGYNIEAMSTRQRITPLNGSPLLHTNHCLFSETDAVAQTRLPESQQNSEARLALAEELLNAGQVTVDQLQALTRQTPICVTATPPFNVESCGAAIMRPKTGDFWAVWGRPSENEYEHFLV
ncbi:MAG: C45 family peptidase [Anaerolineae bacterium]|nr:C45 family peptidase [Anaerolineae bacterium]